MKLRLVVHLFGVLGTGVLAMACDDDDDEDEDKG